MKNSVTYTYRFNLFNIIQAFRRAQNKTASERMHLMNMEAEYRDLINGIADKRITEYRTPKSERKEINRIQKNKYWTPKVTHVCKPS